MKVSPLSNSTDVSHTEHLVTFSVFVVFYSMGETKPVLVWCNTEPHRYSRKDEGVHFLMKIVWVYSLFWREITKEESIQTLRHSRLLIKLLQSLARHDKSKYVNLKLRQDDKEVDQNQEKGGKILFANGMFEFLVGRRLSSIQNTWV